MSTTPRGIRFTLLQLSFVGTMLFGGLVIADDAMVPCEVDTCNPVISPPPVVQPQPAPPQPPAAVPDEPRDDPPTPLEPPEPPKAGEGDGCCRAVSVP